MAGKREQQKKQTRQAILQAALALFPAKGYKATTMDDLARQAGVGKGTLYTYFPGKSSIFLTIIEEQLAVMAKTIAGTFQGSQPLLQRLVVIYQEEFRFITKYPEFGRILMRETYFPRDLDPDLLKRQEQRYIDLLLPVLGEAQLAGELREELNLLHVLGHLYGLYTVVLSAWFRGQLSTKTDCITLLTTLFEQALQGLMPQPQNAHE